MTHAYSYAGFALTGVDEFGTEWTVQRTSGWHDGVGVRVSRETRAGQDGEYDSPSHREGREVSLIGLAINADHAAMAQSGLLFTGLPLAGEVIGESDGMALSGRARIIDQPKFEHRYPLPAVWQLTVVMPDPLKYGPSLFAATGLEAPSGTGLVFPLAFPLDFGVAAGTTPGALSLPNAGKATYWPRLRIDGPVVNPVVTLNDTGAWVRVERDVAAGQWLDIDTGLRRVLLNGQVSVGPQVTYSGNWLGVPPGGASMSWAADTSDPDAQLSVWHYEGAWP